MDSTLAKRRQAQLDDEPFDFIDRLPPDVVASLFLMLEYKEVFSACQRVCKKFADRSLFKCH